jgi:hypothetical protein
MPTWDSGAGIQRDVIGEPDYLQDSDGYRSVPDGGDRLHEDHSNQEENNLDFASQPLCGYRATNLIDLYRLYQFVILNKRTTVLEFGSGYSSLIFAIALNELNSLCKNKIIKLRRNNPFELFIVENSKKYLNNTKKLIKNFSKKLKLHKINYQFSNVKMTTFNDCISTSYEKLPLCNPDFIYLDGPDQFNIKRKVNNISTAHKDMMPMANDILKIEHFLTPGTIIIVDGRGANAQFLKNNFRRNWLYKHDERNDQHIFYLNAIPLGEYNKLQLEFYKS